MTIRCLQDTFTIPLTQGQVALVDERDFYQLRKHNWYAWFNKDTQSFYARRNIKKGYKRTSQWMHRFILGLEHGDKCQGDHVNHNTLDNRRENLRIVTNRKNQENRRDQSKYGVGVKIDKRDGKFRIQVQVNGRRESVGYFSTVEEAQEAREKFLRKTSRMR